MFNQQIARIVQHHFSTVLKFPRDIAQILVEQQKNNSAFMAAWQVLVEEHQKTGQHIDGHDIVQIEVDNVKQSFVAFHPPIQRLSLLFKQVREQINYIYQLQLMLCEWHRDLKLNEYPQYYLPLLAFFLKIKHHNLENIWLIEDLLKVDESLMPKIYTQNINSFQSLWQNINTEPKLFFKSQTNNNQEDIKLLEFMPLKPEGLRDCTHYLLEYIELYIMHRMQNFLNQEASPCYTKQSLSEGVINFLLNNNLI